jgi:ElaB/YqjD/DUF883 family membrane-anchored ribosome-binding protein
MADTKDAQPMSDADVAAPPAGTDFAPAAPLKDAGVGFEPEGGTIDQDAGAGAGGAAAQTLRDGAAKLSQQAGDRARTLAEQGKTRAAGALDQLTQMLNDAAGQVDDKLGEQYGQYARQAASTVQGFSSQIQDKDLDAILDDARAFVRKSPAVAIGLAAAAGFVLARLVSSGLDQRDL